MTRLLVVLVMLLAGCQGDSAPPASPVASAERSDFKILVFSKTAGFRHNAIPEGIRLLNALGLENNFGVDATEDASAFTAENLAQYQAVVWLNTTGTVLEEDSQRQAFEQFIRRGGGYVGIHAAADTEYDWPFYEQLVGAYFKCHPLQQYATLINEAPTEPSMRSIPLRWTIYEEFYSFQSNPRERVNVLMSIDESSYLQSPNTTNLPGSPSFPFGESGTMGDHPMVWCHDNLGGVAWYTALGHGDNMYRLNSFKTHILNGVLTAARQIPANCRVAKP